MSRMLAAKCIAEAIDRHVAVQERMAHVQEQQLNMDIEKAAHLEEIIEGIEKAGKELWEEIVNCESYKKYIKSTLDK